MIKISSLNKSIYLINDLTHYEANVGSILFRIASMDEMHLVYTEIINKNKIEIVFLFNENLSQLFTFYSSMFRIIEAAGGLVSNNKHEWLFIFRNGKWDLPKGKIEKKEAITHAAIREVEEECGISNLKIIKELPSTFHTYSLEEKEVLKRTYWFEMTSDDTSTLTPQIEEDITEVKWINKNNFDMVFANTYDSVKDIMSTIKSHKNI
jgi:8-oxo-dGTP pyrophosphatase MutT (NUDIX family)